MQVLSELLRELTDVINAISSELQPKVKGAVDEIARRYANEKGTIAPDLVAAFRADVVAAMDILCSGAADLAAVHASELYDKVREAAVSDSSYRAVADSFRVPAKTEGAIRAFVESVVKTGRADAFSSACASRLDYEMRRAAAECMAGNARRDPLKPKWARVPAGAETCSFCLMLASFGTNYNGEDSISHVHANCDCRMVQMYDGMTIEGYDPDRAYVQTLKCLETIGGREGLQKDWKALPESKRAAWIEKRGSESEAFDAYLNKRLSAEMATRDVEWLKTGKVPRVSFASEKAKREIEKHRPHEKRTAERLSTVGFKCVLGGDSKKVGKDKHGRTLFAGHADNPDGVEFKTVLTSNNAYGAVKNYFDNSLDKKNLKRMVIDNFESVNLSDLDIVEAIEELSEWPEYSDVARWVSIFDKTGKLKDVVHRK